MKICKNCIHLMVKCTGQIDHGVSCNSFEYAELSKKSQHTKLNEEELAKFIYNNIEKKYTCLHKFGELHNNINLGIVQECEKCGYIEKVDLKCEPVKFGLPREIIEPDYEKNIENHGTKELKKLLKYFKEMSLDEYNKLYKRAQGDIKTMELNEIKTDADKFWERQKKAVDILKGVEDSNDKIKEHDPLREEVIKFIYSKLPDTCTIKEIENIATGLITVIHAKWNEKIK